MLYNINNKKIGEKTTRTIRTEFDFNVLPSADKLKRGVPEGTSGLFWFSVIIDVLFYILHYFRLSSTFLLTFVFCSLLFFLNPMLSILHKFLDTSIVQLLTK